MNKYITQLCDKCHGNMVYAYKLPNGQIMELTKCDKCNGTGLIPNQEGEEILELIKKFGGNY